MALGPYYEFDSFRLELTGQLLYRGEKLVPLNASEFAILLTLIQRRNKEKKIVTTQELARVLWGETANQKNFATVTRYVSNLKAKLGDSRQRDESKYIRSFSGKGYQFVYPNVREGGEGAVAVVPFKNLNGETDTSKLGSVMAEFLSTSLTNLKQFPVVPSSRYDDSNETFSAAAEEPPIKFVISGSLKLTGRELLVFLYPRQKGYEFSLPSLSYRVKNTDVFKALEDVSQLAANDLGQILAGEREHFTRPPGKNPRPGNMHTRSVEAHRLYEQAWGYLNRRTPEALIAALKYFTKAAKFDPEFAEAHAGIADCNLLLSIFGSEVIRPRIAMPKAKKAALRALEIDETLAEAHASLASVKFLFDRDWIGAEASFRESIRSNPEYATARQFYSHNLALLGRFDEALEQIRIAQSLRPSPIIDATVSRIYFLARRYDEAVEAAQYAIERYHEFFLGYVHLGIVYRQLGKLPAAIEQLRKAQEYGGTQKWGNPGTLGELGCALAAAGRRAEAKKMISDLQSMSKRQYVGPINLAKIYMGLGDLKRTFELLEQTFLDRSAWLVTLKTDPMYDDLRGHPQFQALLIRVGLP